jgi:hypothetical protein
MEFTAGFVPARLLSSYHRSRAEYRKLQSIRDDENGSMMDLDKRKQVR